MSGGWLTKKRLFAIHGWLGVLFGLPLFVICLAGALAVLAPEMDRAIHPDMRIQAQAGEPLPWGTLLAKIEAACPGGEVRLLNAADHAEEAWSASVSYSSDDNRAVHFNPFSGEVLSQRAPFGVQTFFRIFHKQFFILEGPVWPHGRVVVCVFSIVLLFSAVTGLMFYKGWWKHLARLRVGKGARIFLSDLHRFAGVWTFLLAMLFAVTGLWYLTERLMEDLDLAEHEPMPALSAELMASRPPVIRRLPLDELASTARQAMDGRKIAMVLMGVRPDTPIGFYFQGGMLEGDSANRVFLDPYSGAIIERVRAGDSSLGMRLESAVNPLHFGRFGGWLTKLIWTLAGLAICAGILAGAWIYWMRVGKSGGGIARRWTRAALVLNLMIFGLAGVSTVGFIRNLVKGPGDPAGFRSLGISAVGPWHVEAFRQLEAGKESAAVKFRFLTEGDPNFRRASAGESRVQGHRTVFAGKSAPGKELRFSVEMWDGTIHTAAFPSGAAAETISAAPASPMPWQVWATVGVFFVLAGAPAAIWLMRLG